MNPSKVGLVPAMVHPEALVALNRMKSDQKAGHDAEDYWRGAAAAYFTANPSPINLGKCQCESSTCEHKTKPCPNDSLMTLKTIYGKFNMCPKCAYNMPYRFIK
jgi:hypothetical protein